MSSFDERLAAAKAKPRPHADVTVCLDQDAADERDRLVEALGEATAKDEADKRLAGPSDVNARPIQEALDALQATMRDSLVTLRFVQLHGYDWAELTTKHPARRGVELDMAYGYNLDAVVRAAAKFEDPKRPGKRYALRLEGDDWVALTDKQIDDLWETLTGSEVSNIRDAVWGLNDFLPNQRIEALVKGFGAATRSETN